MDVNTSLTNIGADTKMRVRGRGCADECGGLTCLV